MAHADVPGAPGTGPEEGKAGPLGELPEQVKGQIDASSKPDGSDESAAGAVDNAAKLLQGGKAGAAAGEVKVPAAASGAGSAPLAKADPAKPAPSAAVPAVSAEQPKAPKPINSLAAYKVTRFVLAAIATHWGVVYPMPPASPELTQKILQSEAKDAKVVFSDIDDTLTKFNTHLSPETGEGIVLVKKAGKTFAAITDRGDYAKPGSTLMGALETMSAIPAGEREGVIAATNGGGKIYEADSQGEWKLIYEEPGLPEEQRPLIAAAAASVKAGLSSMGTEALSENPGPYGYSLILKAGTPEAVVKALAHRLEAELKSRGLDYEVEGRMAKDPTLPPYVTFSKLNKSLAVRRIIEVKKLQGQKALGMGDSMYAPQKPAELQGLKARTAPWAMRVGQWLSGQRLPITGNRTDANMEHGNPGMLMLSVGGTGDPRMPDGYVLAGKGPAQSLQILRAVSSAPAPEAGHADKIMAALAFIFILGYLAVIGWLGYQLLREWHEAVYAEINSIPSRMDMHP